jgi:hypothetical protein
MSNIDIGTLIAIAPGVPATFDAAGYAALTWVNIVGLQSIGEMGDENETIAIPDLTAGRIRTRKGAATGTTVSIALRAPLPAETATGQANLKTAATGTGATESSFRVTDASGNIDYFSGVPMNWKRTERTTSSFEGYTCDVALNYPIVLVAAV